MKQSERSVLILFIVLLLVLVIVVAGIFFYQRTKYGDQFFEYRGFEVSKVDAGYRFKIFINEGSAPQYFTIRTDPRTLEDVLVDGAIVELKKKEEIFAVVDPDENLTGRTTMAVLELDKIIDNPHLFNIPLNAALTKEKEGSGLSVRDCNDANVSVGVVWFTLGERTLVYERGGCFIVEGKTEDELIRAADKIVLLLLGIDSR